MAFATQLGKYSFLYKVKKLSIGSYTRLRRSFGGIFFYLSASGNFGAIRKIRRKSGITAGE
jgi:hypothetical protein